MEIEISLLLVPVPLEYLKLTHLIVLLMFVIQCSITPNILKSIISQEGLLKETLRRKKEAL